jgi:hypothetical protein
MSGEAIATVAAVVQGSSCSNGTRPIAVSTKPLPTGWPTTQDERLKREIESERRRRQARRAVDAEERGPTPPLPEVIALDQLTAEETSIAWRIESWLPRESRVVCVAAMKTGKTTLVGNLARALLDGDPWLGRHVVAPLVGSVALLDTEMSPGQLKTWLRQQQIAHADRLKVVSLRQRTATFDILDAQTRERWATELRELHVEVVVLDCLRPVLDACGLDEHREIGRFLVAFDALLEEAGISEAVIVHHMGHVGERSRGDSRLEDWADAVWKLVRQKAEDPSSSRYISAYGRDVDIRESLLAYDPTTRRLTLAAGSRRDAAVRDALNEILALLGTSAEPLTCRAIEESCHNKGHRQRAIRDALVVGVQSKQIATQDGPRRAILHSLATGSASSASECVREPLTHSACESVSVRHRPIGRRTTHTSQRVPRSRGKKADHAAD